jgi:hypothetical protein
MMILAPTILAQIFYGNASRFVEPLGSGEIWKHLNNESEI